MGLHQGLQLGAPPSAGGLRLSNSSIAENASIGDLVGAFTNKRAGMTLEAPDETFFYLDGDNLKVNGALDYETATSHQFTVTQANGVDDPIHKTFTIRVTNVADLGPELVTNGSFDSDTGWTKGTGWTIGTGVASRTNTGSTSNLVQNVGLTIGHTYEVSFTMSNRATGSVIVYVGIGHAGSSAYTTNATHTFQAVCAGNSSLYFAGSATFAGDIDNVSVKRLA